MSRPTRAAGTQTELLVPSDLTSAFEAMVSGERSFAEFRSDLANVLYLDFRSAEAVETYLRRQHDRGELPEHLLKVAITDIQRICAEDVPTLIDTDRIIQRRLAEQQSQPRERPEPAPVKSLEPRAKPAQPERTSAPPANPKVGDVLAGRFELLERIDSGSMSVVYRARDRQVADGDGILAVKVVNHKLSTNGHALRALMDEAEKGVSIRHRGIVRYDGLHRDDKLIFIAMEWLDGETLAERLNRNPGKPLDRATALKVITELGAALSHVHGRGLVHADVKPGNVFLCRDGRIKLLDFGIARAWGELARERVGFDPGVLGAATPAYASYDLLKGADAQPADDIYSFGCLVYRLCSGSRVYGKLSAVEAREAGRRPAAIDSLTDRQWTLLSDALRFDRDARPGDAETFAREFVEAGRPALAPIRPLPATPPPSLAVLDESEPRGYAGFALSMAAALVIGFGAFVAYQRLTVPPQAGVATGTENSAVESSQTVVETPPAFVEDSEPVPMQPSVERTDSLVAGDPAAPRQESGVDDDAAAPDGVDLAARAEPVTLVPAATDTRTPAAQGESRARNDRIPPSLSLLADEPFDGLALMLGETGVEPEGRPLLTLSESADPIDITLVRPASASGSQRYRFVVSSAEPGRFLNAGERLEVRPAIVRFGGDDTQQRVQLVPRPNARLTPDERLNLSVVSLDAPDVLEARVTVEVVDDQLRQAASLLGDDVFGFTVNAMRVDESSAAAVLTVVRANPTDSTQLVRWTLTEGSARDGEDFFSPVSNVIEFGPEQRSQTLLISLISDNVAELDESFTVALTDAIAGSPLPQRVEVRIADDDFR